MYVCYICITHICSTCICVYVHLYIYVCLYVCLYICICIYVCVCVCAFYKALRSQRCSGLPKYLTFLPRPRNKHCFKKPMEQLLASFEMSWAGINVPWLPEHIETQFKGAFAFSSGLNPVVHAVGWNKSWNGHHPSHRPSPEEKCHRRMTGMGRSIQLTKPPLKVVIFK